MGIGLRQSHQIDLQLNLQQDPRISPLHNPLGPQAQLDLRILPLVLEKQRQVLQTVSRVLPRDNQVLRIVNRDQVLLLNRQGPQHQIDLQVHIEVVVVEPVVDIIVVVDAEEHLEVEHQEVVVEEDNVFIDYW